MMMKRGKVDKQGESMVASYRYLGVSNPGLQMIGSNECDVSFCKAPGPHSSISEEFFILFSGQEALRQLESCQPSSQYE